MITGYNENLNVYDIIIIFFLKLTVHSIYTEKLQINEQIKLYTIYTNTAYQNCVVG